MYCTNCGKQIADEARFCEHCGAPVETMENGSSGQGRPPVSSYAPVSSGYQTVPDMAGMPQTGESTGDKKEKDKKGKK